MEGQEEEKEKENTHRLLWQSGNRQSGKGGESSKNEGTLVQLLCLLYL